MKTLPEEEKNRFRQLRSGNRNAIMDTLEVLRREGNVAFLPGLIDLMAEQEEGEIRDKIQALLSDLKNQEAAEILAAALIDPAYREIQKEIASACWQNSLRYGKFLDAFLEVLFTGSYDAAIEAFTVIEEAARELEQKQLKSTISRIKQVIPESDDQKKALYSELIKSLNSHLIHD